MTGELIEQEEQLIVNREGLARINLGYIRCV